MCAVITGHAQGKFWNSKNAYLGQRPPGDKPEAFAREMITKRDTFAFDRVAFSDDGTEFYYPSSNTWFNVGPAKIRYFKFSKGKWNGPFVLNEHYASPSFSSDGNKLYFTGGKPDKKHFIVWQSTRKPEGGWTEPSVYIAAPYALYDFMTTNSGTCYAGSGVHADTSRHDMDICEYKMNPGDTTIRSLGEPINTKGFDGDFFVSRDESYMIVSTKETKTYECELWITFHKPDGNWTPLATLGPNINNGIAHRWGQYVTPDGKYLFYSTGHSPADCHIVWVRFDKLLAKLKKENLGS